MIKVYNSGLLNFGAENIRRVCALEGAMYIDDYAWTEDQAWSLFYTPVLRKPEHKHYWGIRRQMSLDGKGPVVIRDFTDKQPFWFTGVIHVATNSFVYSRTVHDYYQAPDLPFAIDGGGEYCRIVGNIDYANDLIHAQFNPQTMEIRRDGKIIDSACYVSADRRSLRS